MTDARSGRDEEPLEYVVESGEAGMRLDRFVKSRIPALSRVRLRVLLEEGRVRCNGRAGLKGLRVARGDRVRVEGITVGGTGLLADPDPSLEVLFEDPFLVAVDKSPGKACIPLRRGETGTVANALVARYPEMQGIGLSERDAGLLHRLDRDTSGVLLAARSTPAFQSLKAEFMKGRVTKIYLALVHGQPQSSEGRVKLAIGSRTRRAGRVEVLGPLTRRGCRSVRAAETRFREVRSYGSFTLVRLSMTTGARHQLRAHMASIGCPIAGDRLYGPRAQSAEGVEVPPRQLLHASEIQFIHPADGRRMRIRSPLEKGFAQYLKGLV